MDIVGTYIGKLYFSESWTSQLDIQNYGDYSNSLEPDQMQSNSASDLD